MRCCLTNTDVLVGKYAEYMEAEDVLQAEIQVLVDEYACYPDMG